MTASPVPSSASGRSVLVIGGSSDIGAALAEAFLRQGSGPVVLAGRSESRMAPVADRLRAIDPAASVSVERFDAADTASVVEMVHRVRERLGRIDIAVISIGLLIRDGAGRRDVASFAPGRIAEYVHESLDVNATAPIAAGLILAEIMRQQSQGLIIAISSATVQRADTVNPVYAAGKAAMDRFFIGQRERLRSSGVEVFVVRAGGVRTSMTPDLQWALTPQELATRICGQIDRGRTEPQVIARRPKWSVRIRMRLGRARRRLLGNR